MAKAKCARTKKVFRPKKGKSKPAKTIGILQSGTNGRHDKEITALMKGLRTAGSQRQAHQKWAQTPSVTDLAGARS